MNIVRFKDGDRLDADALNAPIVQIEKAINSLELAQDKITNHSYLTYNNAVCRPDVAVGDVVYYDKEGFISKALSVYSSSFADKGGLLAMDSAYPIGIVSDKVGTQVTVITNGIIPSSLNLLQYITSEDNPAGDYYLSSTDAGKVSKNQGAVPVKVLTISSDNTISINITQPPTNYHKHTYIHLTGWEKVTDKDVTLAPEGFSPVWKYVGGTPEELARALYILSNFGTTYVFVKDGRITLDGVFAVTDNTILCNTYAVGDVYLFANLPCVADQPVVRAIKSSNPRLSVTSDQGVVTIDMDGYTVDDTLENSATAVSNIKNDGTLQKTPVVSNIVTDNTITAQRMANGVISLSTYGTTRTVYPDMVSLDLALTTVVNNRILYVLPAGISSGVLGRISLPAPPPGLEYEITPFIEPIGVDGEYPFNAEISVEWVSEGTSEGSDITYTPKATTSIAVSVQNNKVYFTKASGALIHTMQHVEPGDTLTPGGTVFIKIETSSLYSRSQYFLGFGVIVRTI